MTFAIIMLAVILSVVIAGSFLPQDNGIRYIYESWWFYGLNFLLMTSILSCASRRIRTVYRYAFRVPVVHRQEFYRAGDSARTLETSLPVAGAALAAVKALRTCHYRVEMQQRDGRTYVLADRWRVMRLGSLISHFSIVVMVGAIAWGALAGWLDKTVLVEAGGAAVPIGHGTRLMLRSDSFDFGFYPSGAPRNFHDHLTIVDAQGHEQHDMIDVNTPWYYGGIFGYDVHQASYAVSARLIAIDPTQKYPTPLKYCVIEDTAEDCTTPFSPMLMAPLGDGSYRPIGNGLSAFYLPDRDLAITATFHDPVPRDKLPSTLVVTVVKPPRKAGQTMRILREEADIPTRMQNFNGQVEQVSSQPIDVGGLRIAILVRRVAGLNIGHNPAVPLIFTSFALILIGLVSVLYFPFSRLWLYVGPAGAEGPASMVMMRGAAEKSKQGFKRRFEVIARTVQRELDAARREKSMEGGES